jgi:hypothetical protein
MATAAVPLRPTYTVPTPSSDGKITTACSTNVCKLVNEGGPFGAQAQVDGTGPPGTENAGIDNSFGENDWSGLLAAEIEGWPCTGGGGCAFCTVRPPARNVEVPGLAKGELTDMIEVTGLDGTSTQTSIGLSGQVFLGGPFPAIAGKSDWTTDDHWPILGGPSLLANPDGPPPYRSKMLFEDAYVVNGTWVSGKPTTIQLAMTPSFTLTIHEAVITFELSSATHAANGVISGVLETEEVKAQVIAYAGLLSASLCNNSSALSGVLAQIEESQDIRHDATNPGPEVSCDAISIGLGFSADAIALPTVLSAPQCPRPNPCSGAAYSCDAGNTSDASDAESTGDSRDAGNAGDAGDANEQ